MNEAAAELLTTLVMVPVSYALLRIYWWGISKIEPVSGWERGFGWGMFFWAPLSSGLYKAAKLWLG